MATSHANRFTTFERIVRHNEVQGFSFEEDTSCVPDRNRIQASERDSSNP